MGTTNLMLFHLGYFSLVTEKFPAFRMIVLQGFLFQVVQTYKGFSFWIFLFYNQTFEKRVMSYNKWGMHDQLEWDQVPDI